MRYPTMIDRLTKVALLAAYQSAIVLGIAMLPLALVARQAGITLPLHHLIERTETAYRQA
ncbi:MAG: hypothetical protein ABEJ58_05415 [Halodesulfurarchaeum sp.]